MITQETSPLSGPAAQTRVVLMSIKPCYWERILRGSKQYELRRKVPRLKQNDVVLVYASAPEKALVGAFAVERILSAAPREVWKQHQKQLGIERSAYFSYFEGADVAWAIEVSRPVKFDTVSLEALRQQLPGFRPPQSFMYWSSHDKLRWVAPSLAIAGYASFSVEQTELAWSKQASPPGL